MELLTNALLAALPAYLEGLPLPLVLGVDGVRGGNNAIPTFVDIKVKYVVGECLLRLYSNSSVGVDGCLLTMPLLIGCSAFYFHTPRAKWWREVFLCLLHLLILYIYHHTRQTTGLLPSASWLPRG